MISTTKIIYMKVFLTLLIITIYTLGIDAQPVEFSYVNSSISAQFVGKAEINNTPAQEGDWIAAFDSDGVCVGANPIVFSSNNAYFTLRIYGNESNTPDIDEGMEEGELFTVKIWDSDLSSIISYPNDINPTMFPGWSDNNGNPIDFYSDPNAIYNFTTLFTLGCTNMILPLDNAVNVETSTLLQWFNIPNTTGYKISIGDEPGVYNFIDQVDLGNSSSVYIDSFECATTYYVKIFPYNDLGVQINCAEEQFSTIFNIANAGPNIKICNGSAIQLSGSGGIQYHWSPSTGLSDTLISNPFASPLETTSYVLTATNQNGCSDTDTVIVQVLPAPDINLTITNETSPGANNGSAFSNPTGGEEPYTFLWSNGSTSSSIVDLEPGSYSVTVTSLNQCSTVEEFEILGYNCLSFNVLSSITTISCHNDCDGIIAILNVQNATEPLSFLWNNGETTDTISNICSGQYTVTITDSDNCSAVRTFIVNNPDIIQANITSVAESSTNAHDGLAFADPIGGTAPYYYSWSNGDENNVNDSLTPGNYILTVTDNKGCNDIEITTINQYGCDDFQVFVTKENVSCIGDCDGRLTIDLVVGGVEPYTYQWSNDSVGSVIDTLCPNTYMLTVTDADNCNTFGVYTITEPLELVMNLHVIGESGEGANNASASVAPLGGIPPYFYNWSTGNNTSSINNLSPGEYSVTILDSNVCSKVENFVIDTFHCPQLIVNKSINNITCNGVCDGNINIEVTEGLLPYSYSWNNGWNANYISELCEDIYIVTITDSNGCTISDTSYIDEPETMNLNFNISHESGVNSHDGSINTFVSGGEPPYYYNWNTGQTDPELTNLIPGVYNLTVTDTRNCEIIKNNLVILPFSCPELSIDYFIEHLKCPNICDGSITITNIYEGTFPFTYNWSNGESTNSIIDKCGGSYNLTITDNNNCQLIKSFTIEEPEPYFIAFDYEHEKSSNGSGYIHAEIQGGTQPYQWEWNTGSTNLNIDNLSAGSYTLSVTDANGCSLEKTLEILDVDCSLLNITSEYNSNTCYNSYDSYINITITNGAEPYTIKWDNGFEGLTQSQLSAGTYTVTITDFNGCVESYTYEISTPDKLEASIDYITHINNSNGTSKGAIKINVDGGTAPYTYLWTSSSSEFMATTKNIDNLDLNCYHLELTDANDCESSFDVCISDYTSVEDEDITKKLSIYPNPANDKLYITIDDVVPNSIEAAIYDLSGKLILKHAVANNKMELKISDINDGLYFLQIRIEDNLLYKKIYIQK